MLMILHRENRYSGISLFVHKRRIYIFTFVDRKSMQDKTNGLMHRLARRVS